MTTVIEELEIDWAPFEALKDERPCLDCSSLAVWMQTFTCCGKEFPKCDGHKKMMEAEMRRVQGCFSVTWHCQECGAEGRLVPGMKVWDLVIWRPL